MRQHDPGVVAVYSLKWMIFHLRSDAKLETGPSGKDLWFHAPVGDDESSAQGALQSVCDAWPQS